ncbi:MAG TPA: hypothetical protein VJ888_09845 [Mobilitalea sp.]|nr:hypothetical protein [Mobilitalea sp.]
MLESPLKQAALPAESQIGYEQPLSAGLAKLNTGQSLSMFKTLIISDTRDIRIITGKNSACMIKTI